MCQDPRITQIMDSGYPDEHWRRYDWRADYCIVNSIGEECWIETEYFDDMDYDTAYDEAIDFKCTLEQQYLGHEINFEIEQY